VATIGYTSVGDDTSQSVGADEINISQITTPASAGSIASLTARLYTESGTTDYPWGAAIYSDNGSDMPDVLLAQDSGNGTIIHLAGPQWLTVNLSYNFAPNTKFWIASFIPVGCGYKYDSGGGSNPHRYYQPGGGFENWPSPWGGVGTVVNRQVCVYVTYTTGSGIITEQKTVRVRG
jgi:hypothetical protein